MNSKNSVAGSGLERLEFTRKKRSPPVIVEEVDGEVVVRRGDRVVVRGTEAALRYLFTCPRCGKRASWVVRSRAGYLYACHSQPEVKKHMWMVGPKSPVLERLASMIGSREYILTDVERSAAAKLAEIIGDSAGQLRVILQALASAEKIEIYLRF